jgi:hypothetical protein
MFAGHSNSHTGEMVSASATTRSLMAASSTVRTVNLSTRKKADRMSRSTSEHGRVVARAA